MKLSGEMDDRKSQGAAAAAASAMPIPEQYGLVFVKRFSRALGIVAPGFIRKACGAVSRTRLNCADFGASPTFAG